MPFATAIAATMLVLAASVSAGAEPRVPVPGRISPAAAITDDGQPIRARPRPPVSSPAPSQTTFWIGIGLAAALRVAWNARRPSGD